MRDEEASRTNAPASREANGSSAVESAQTEISQIEISQSNLNLGQYGLIAERWELLEHIGEGGMSDVFKARHVLMNKIGAVKFLKGNLSTDPVAVKRFQQEALACGQLAHPNIVQTYDCGLSEKGFYLILEYLEGTSLADILDDLSLHAEDGRGKLSLEDAVPIFMQVCDSLEHAHRKGIVHRDIKPSNVMLAYAEGHPENTVVKLVDFGIAKLVGQGSSGTSDGSLTLTGEVFGSPLYMSPEQCLGRSVDGRSDIYSIGCLMYEALVGKRAILGNSPTETMMKHVHDLPDISALKQLNDPAAEGMEEIIALCLEKAPENRYQTMAELKADLDALPLASKIVPEPPKQPYGASSLFVFSMSVLAVLVTTIMGLAIYYLLPFNESQAANESMATPLAPPPSEAEKRLTSNRNAGQVAPPDQHESFMGIASSVANVDALRLYKREMETGFANFLAGRFLASSKNYQEAKRGITKQHPERKDLLAMATVGDVRSAFFAHFDPAFTNLINLEDLEYQLASLLRETPDDNATKISEQALTAINELKARIQFSQKNYNGALGSIDEMMIHDKRENLDSARWLACEADLKRLFSTSGDGRDECVPLFQKALELLTNLNSDDQKLLGDINYRLGLSYLDLNPKDYAAAAQVFRAAADYYTRAAVKTIKSDDVALLEQKAKNARRKVFETTKEFDSFSALLYKVQNGV